MPTYRYRHLITIRDQVVGVALETPGGLTLRLGSEEIEFDHNAPKLENLPLFVEKISENPQYKKLELWGCGPIKRLESPSQPSWKRLLAED